MPELQKVLSSGDITEIHLGSAAPHDAVPRFKDIEAEVQALMSAGVIPAINIGGTGAGNAAVTMDDINAAAAGFSQFMLGSIQHSILDETQFDSILPDHEKGKWALADGRDITGKGLANITGENTLPDLRGAYLRMAGQNSNPAWDGGSLRGYQEDKTARPSTAFTTDQQGNHYHSMGVYESEANDILQQYYNNTANSPSVLAKHMRKLEDPFSGGNAAEGPELELAVSTDGQHSHTINGGGDAETRPKSYSINYFIKVD